MKIVNRNILITMAGRGQRFIENGFKDSKPLIMIYNEPMIDWAMKSLKDISGRFIFIYLQSLDKNYNLSDHLINKYGQETLLIPIEEVTEGQACTALLAKSYIDNDIELIIFNCDTFFCHRLLDDITRFPRAKGFIPVFDSYHPKWSYCKIDDHGKVIEVAEKRVISNHATAGLYHFKYGRDFVWAAEKMINKKNKVNNEYYIGPAYNELIKRGDEIRISGIDFIWCMGTPEELKNFEKSYSFDSDR
ncbi:MAG: glycosyltransferase family 2 protein [Ignavibacteria bacterium]|jgi:dTDP-glucose pyrophosphorylase